VWVDLAPDGRVVLLSNLGHLEAAPECIEETGVMTDSEEKVRHAVTTAALDAPLIVRIEMGAVTLPARQWAEVAPGDVLRTGRRIADPVTLRVAGHSVARGELVNVEGELGVRIRELCDGGDV
jgi:flagellar motor switch/type III secretory pathway protein FliN